MRYIKLKITLSILSVFSVIFLIYYNFLGPLKMEIHNHSGNTLKNVVISGNEFKEIINELETGKSHKFWLTIKGESGLRLEYETQDKLYDKNDLAYLESGASYNTNLLFMPEGIICVEHVGARFCK